MGHSVAMPIVVRNPRKRGYFFVFPELHVISEPLHSNIGFVHKAFANSFFGQEFWGSFNGMKIILRIRSAI